MRHPAKLVWDFSLWLNQQVCELWFNISLDHVGFRQQSCPIILYKITLWFNEGLFCIFIDSAPSLQLFSHEVKRDVCMSLPSAYFSITALAMACLSIPWVFSLLCQGFEMAQKIYLLCLNPVCFVQGTFHFSVITNIH